MLIKYIGREGWRRHAILRLTIRILPNGFFTQLEPILGIQLLGNFT
jgi:hypothetical protein